MKLGSASLIQKLMIGAKYIRNRVAGHPLLVTIEMPQFCNARYDFCNCWKTEISPKLGDYVDMVDTLNPIVLALTGGEPMVRKDLPTVISEIKEHTRWIYIYMVTNGSLLTEEKAKDLFAAGLDQLSISVNYLDHRLNEERRIEGLYERISDMVPRITADSTRNVMFNTVIMEDNLDQIPLIPERAREWGAKVSFSCYTDFKDGNGSHLIQSAKLDQLQDVVDQLVDMRSRYRNIVNSEYYLRKIPEYFGNGGIAGCTAGRSFVQLIPAGEIRACPDFAPGKHYSEYDRHGVENHGCTKCWHHYLIIKRASCI